MNFPQLTQHPFGATPDGPATLYTLKNERGMEAQITDYGGILRSLHVPDEKGNRADVVLGYDTLDEYLRNGRFFGALVGRYANRIADGAFCLDGKRFQLVKNHGAHHIHGGKRGFDKRLWQSKATQKAGNIGVELSLLSPDGEAGYPGNLQTRVSYWLSDANELRLDYEAVCDRPTILNLTNHSYFNLAGAGQGDILNHVLTLDAQCFTPVDQDKIPTGEVRLVNQSPFDFRVPTRIGARIETGDEQLHIGNGYDHNFVLNGAAGELKRAAQVFEPDSGRTMEVWTTQPGVQFFSGNNFERPVRGKDGQKYAFRGAFCLETGHFPDSPHQNHFPTVVLRPGATYRHTTIFRFST